MKAIPRGELFKLTQPDSKMLQDLLQNSIVLTPLSEQENLPVSNQGIPIDHPELLPKHFEPSSQPSMQALGLLQQTTQSKIGIDEDKFIDQENVINNWLLYDYFLKPTSVFAGVLPSLLKEGTTTYLDYIVGLCLTSNNQYTNTDIINKMASIIKLENGFSWVEIDSQKMSEDSRIVFLTLFFIMFSNEQHFFSTDKILMVLNNVYKQCEWKDNSLVNDMSKIIEFFSIKANSPINLFFLNLNDDKDVGIACLLEKGNEKILRFTIRPQFSPFLYYSIGKALLKKEFCYKNHLLIGSNCENFKFNMQNSQFMSQKPKQNIDLVLNFKNVLNPQSAIFENSLIENILVSQSEKIDLCVMENLKTNYQHLSNYSIDNKIDVSNFDLQSIKRNYLMCTTLFFMVCIDDTFLHHDIQLSYINPFIEEQLQSSIIDIPQMFQNFLLLMSPVFLKDKKVNSPSLKTELTICLSESNKHINNIFVKLVASSLGDMCYNSSYNVNAMYLDILPKFLKTLLGKSSELKIEANYPAVNNSNSMFLKSLNVGSKKAIYDDVSYCECITILQRKYDLEILGKGENEITQRKIQFDFIVSVFQEYIGMIKTFDSGTCFDLLNKAKDMLQNSTFSMSFNYTKKISDCIKDNNKEVIIGLDKVFNFVKTAGDLEHNKNLQKN